MTTLILLGLAPFVWPLLAKTFLQHTPTLSEWSAHALLAALLVIGLHAVSGYAPVPGREIANGQILDKLQENGEAGTVWVLNSQVGKIVVPSMDRSEPVAYRDARIGDPVAQWRPYVVYRKTALPSWLATEASAPLDTGDLPDYPDALGGWTLDRVVLHRVTVPQPERWNRQLANLNGRLGPLKDANVILVFTHDDPAFAARLRAKWTSRQANDVIAVLGLHAAAAGGLEIDWAHVISRAEPAFNIELEARLVGLRQLSMPAVLMSLGDQVEKNFTRPPLPDTAHLKDRLDPPAHVAVILFGIAFLGSFLSTLAIVIRRVRRARR